MIFTLFIFFCVFPLPSILSPYIMMMVVVTLVVIFDFDFEIFYLVMNINTYMTFLQSLQSWNISFNGQKGWDTKQILFMLSPLPYFVLKMQWDTWDKLAA